MCYEVGSFCGNKLVYGWDIENTVGDWIDVVLFNKVQVMAGLEFLSKCSIFIDYGPILCCSVHHIQYNLVYNSLAIVASSHIVV